jgi:hypothetical protein
MSQQTRALKLLSSFLLGSAVVFTGSILPRLTLAQDAPEVTGTIDETYPGEKTGETQPAVTDVASELAAMRAEIAALKAKQDEAEAAALISAGDDSATVTTDQEMLRVYGFMDVGLDKFFVDLNSLDSGFALLRPTTATTFVFGNLNLYFDANPVEHLRTMVELRFTLAPNGEEIQLGPPLGVSYQRTDTTTFDFSSPTSQAQLRLGGIYIERAWSEYAFSDLFKLQWGLFLNPFGIWNLDHGSPTLISLMLPAFISTQMMPTRLLGVHLYGSKFFGTSELGYALHVSNGRGPLDFDFTEDKAVGGRLFFANEGAYGRLVLGTSGYVGTYVDEEKKINLGGISLTSGQRLFDSIETVSYSEQVVGFDAALDLGNLRIRSEAVFRWVNYKGDKTELLKARDGSEQYLPNRLEWSGYFLAAYRTPWKLEPLIEVEPGSKSAVLPAFAGSARASTANIASLALSAGLNVELTTHTLLKTQVVWIRSYDRKFQTKEADVPVVFVRVVNTF